MKQAKEYKLICLRECPTPSGMPLGDSPDKIADYWFTNVPNGVCFRNEVENMIVVTLNTRKKITGHFHVSTGTLDTIITHPREIFRPAIVMNSAAIVIAHNHPSGDPTPSEGDIKTTRDLFRAGQILRIELLDHIVMGIKDPMIGNKGYCSLRELGYFTI